METERTSFVEIGDGLRLPIGFRFRPTDEELVVHYLKRKINSVPLPASVIPEQQVFDRNPWDLPGDLKERRYFFRKINENEKKSSRVVLAGCGYWKAIGRDKPIVISLSQNHHQIVGMKRTLVFFQRKRLQRTRTWWVMNQFFLVDSVAKLSKTQVQNFMVQTSDWVVCSIYQQNKRGARKKGGKKQESNKQGMIEDNMTNNIRGLISSCNNMDSMMIIEEGASTSCSSELIEGVSTSCSSELSEGVSSYDMEVTEEDEEITEQDEEVTEQDEEVTSRECYAWSF